MIKKIAIIGPESTGKSILAQDLAAYFNTIFVSEFARQYIESLDRPYVEEDLLLMAKEQVLLEEEQTLRANKYLFCDTELTVIDIWSQEKYGKTHPWIMTELHKRSYDLYLLLDIDLEWVYDSQRENPDDRDRLLNLYRESLTKRGLKYHLVQGRGDARIENAIKLVMSELERK